MEVPPFAPRQIVVTLTAIPPRFANLPRRFAAIAAQTQRPDRVQLTLPRIYRRFPGERPKLPPLPDWVEVIECEEDFGPATKILPAVERWRGTATDLLLCDDDRRQDRHWIERLTRGRLAKPNHIICERGWNISERFGIHQDSWKLPRALPSPKGGRTFSYKLLRAMSIGLVHPPRKIYAQAGHVDVFEGFLGALIPVSSIPEIAFSIPDIVWTVDDVWLSGMAATTGTMVWVGDEPRPVYSDGLIDRVSSLRDFVEQGVGREGADRLAVEYLRENFGVWK